MKTLTKLRAEIDKIDEHLQNLISERMKLSVEVGKVKRNKGAENTTVYNPEREAEILQQIISRNKGPLADKELIKIFRMLITASRSMQQSTKISFLGPLGTFSHEAVITHFGDVVELLPQTIIGDVLQATERDETNYALVPIENSTEGVVNKTIEACINTSLSICAEIILPIHHHLLSREDDINKITQVYSHQQALAQCQRWLEKKLPHVALLPAKSTSQACMLAAREVNTAAIAGKIALEHHKLHVIAKNIEDEVHNTTRFYVLGKQTTVQTSRDKTSLLVWLAHRPGSLAELLNIFAQNDINLTLIESRPSKQQNWEYYFFLEMEGHQQSKAIANVIQQLLSAEMKVKILGSFPRAI